MNPIRPNPTPLAAPGTPAKAVDTTRSAAQRAFFELAMGKAPAAAPAIQARTATEEIRPSTTTRLVAQPPAEAPSRPLRPGSFLDIRV